MGGIALAFAGIMISVAGWLGFGIIWGASALQWAEPVDMGILWAILAVSQGIALVLCVAAVAVTAWNKEY